MERYSHWSDSYLNQHYVRYCLIAILTVASSFLYILYRQHWKQRMALYNFQGADINDLQALENCAPYPENNPSAYNQIP
jgi:hypothetical protein